MLSARALAVIPISTNGFVAGGLMQFLSLVQVISPIGVWLHFELSFSLHAR
jgi:hypothetical protein